MHCSTHTRNTCTTCVTRTRPLFLHKNRAKAAKQLRARASIPRHTNTTSQTHTHTIMREGNVTHTRHDGTRCHIITTPGRPHFFPQRAHHHTTSFAPHNTPHPRIFCEIHNQRKFAAITHNDDTNSPHNLRHRHLSNHHEIPSSVPFSRARGGHGQPTLADICLQNANQTKQLSLSQPRNDIERTVNAWHQT